jgi:hypothetical protein
MTDIHTSDERIAVADLEAMVDVTLALIEVAARDGCPLACAAVASPRSWKSTGARAAGGRRKPVSPTRS